MAIESINPATEELIARFDEAGAGEIESALSLAQRRFREWRKVPFETRAEALRRAGAYMRSERAGFATLIVEEMGKPITQAEAEVEKCAWACDYYAENAEGFLASIERPTNAARSYVAFEPLGPVLAVMPWNFPFWQVFRFAAPALMAGNVGLLKHSSNVPRCALAIQEVFLEAGFPEGCFQTLLVGSGAVEGLIADERVGAVTLTGSEAAGSRVAEVAGRAIKKTVLELGGSDPFIVLGDADVEAAVKVAVTARNQNAGQSCIAAKRFIVVESAADEFETRLTEAVSRLRVADPAARDTEVGPLARADLRDDIVKQVADSVEMGAAVLTGANALERRGYFYMPTVLSGVSQEMPAFREETFGPVAAVTRARDDGHAIELANDSRFGLGANLWTRDIERGCAIARDIEAGSVFINGMVTSDPRLPFGGVKRSGYGRELSEFGIREFVNVQTVWVAPA
jgi:acyl-CoA reductase-like NAD-dependent aldehyde dehydrogenase